jgi:hypothetical protein
MTSATQVEKFIPMPPNDENSLNSSWRHCSRVREGDSLVHIYTINEINFWIIS